MRCLEVVKNILHWCYIRLFSAEFGARRVPGNVNSIYCWWVYYEGWLLLRFPVGLSLIFPFVVLITWDLCNRSNELEIASVYCDKRTVHLMHEITLILILMSFSAFVSFFWYYNYSVLNLRTLTHQLIVNLPWCYIVCFLQSQLKEDWKVT